MAVIRKIHLYLKAYANVQICGNNRRSDYALNSPRAGDISCPANNLFYLNWANLKTALLWSHRREKPEISTQVGENPSDLQTL